MKCIKAAHSLEQGALKHCVDRFDQRAILRTARDRLLDYTLVTYGPGVIFQGSLRVLVEKIMQMTYNPCIIAV